MKTRILIFLGCMLGSVLAYSQNDYLHIGSSAKEASAILQIDKTDKGILIPRMTTTQRNAIVSPVNGLMVYDTTTNSFWFYDGTSWCNAAVPTSIFDKDGDTGVDVEIGADQDDIRMLMEGAIVLDIKENVHGQVIYRTNSGGPSTNLFIGALCGGDSKPNLSSVGVGYACLDSLTTGFSNTALGSGALFKNKTGFENTAVGSNALQNNLTFWNTAVGGSSLSKNTTGNYNTSVGARNMLNNTIGISNVSVGATGMHNNISGCENSVVGAFALYKNTTGSSNVAIGDSSLHEANASFNVAIGDQAMSQTTSGFSQTAVGYAALSSNTTGSHNTGVGESSLSGNIGGNYNTALGDDSGLGITNGNHNIAIGNETLRFAGDISFLTAVGDSALHKVGQGTIASQGTMNTAFGAKAMKNTTTGQSNTAIGHEVLYHNTGGDFCVAVGKHALKDNTTGDWNTAVGTSSLLMNTDGDRNTALGYQAMYENTTGLQNTAIGYDAHYNADTGDKNTALGAGSLYGTESGNNNTAIGHEAGYTNVQGDGNVFIGYQAGYSETGNNTLYIDNSNTANPLIYGDFSADTLSVNGLIGVNTLPDADVSLHIKQDDVDKGIRLEYEGDTDFWDTYIDFSNDYNFGYNGSLISFISDTDGSYNIISDRRLKANIQDLGSVVSKLQQLNPKTYFYLADKTQSETMGFIAQDLEEVFPELVRQKGDIKTVNYTGLSVIAVQAVKEQQETINSQQAQIDNILGRLEALEKELKK